MRPTLATFKGIAAPASQPFKRAQLGLFQGKSKQYGNNVPFSKKKTRRSWLPNVQSKRLFSDALNDFVKVKLTTRALKTIEKYDGIDQYLTQASLPKDLSYEGMRLRVLIQEAQKRPKIDTHASQEDQKRAQALRGDERVLRRGYPTLKDAEKVRSTVLGRLGLSTPNKEAEDPYFAYRKNTKTVVEYVKQQALERRALARRTRRLAEKGQWPAPPPFADATVNEGSAPTDAPA